MRDFGAFSSKQDVFIKFFPSEFRDLCGRGGRKIRKVRSDRLLRGNSVF